MKLRVFADVKVNIKTEDIHRSNVVYRMTFPNGKCYIGLTIQLCEERIKSHCRDSFYQKSDCYNTKKARAIRKYMEFSVDILYQGDDIKEKEIEFIKELNTIEEGYNITSGGDGTNGLSKETYELIASKNRGLKRSDETKLKMSESRIGFKHTQETKDKMKVSAKTSHISPVIQLDKNNNTIINEFISLAEANLSLGKKATSSAITNCLNGRSNTAYGFKWEYKNKTN